MLMSACMFRFSWEKKKFKITQDKLMFRFLVFCLFVLGLSVSSVSVCPQRCTASRSLVVHTVFFLSLPVQYQTKGHGHWRRRRIRKTTKRLEGWLGMRWRIFDSDGSLSHTIRTTRLAWILQGKGGMSCGEVDPGRMTW